MASFLSDLLAVIESRVEDEIAKRDTTISARDTEITTLRNANSSLIAKIHAYEDDLTANGAKIRTLELQIERQLVEIEALKKQIPPPPTPPPPPIEVSPDIEISLAGLGSFRPSLKGDRIGNETRYRGSINPEIDTLIDIKDDGQIAICIERCHADLPIDAPPLQTILNISVGSETYYANPLRLHHHTRPRYVINPSKPPRVDLKSLISSALIPNYDTTTTVPETDLVKIANGNHPWPTQLSYDKAPKGFDPISEVYGQIVNSWSGGAGPLLNEAAHLMPVQCAYLLAQDPRAWAEMIRLANSSGNYAIHYKLRGENAVNNPYGRIPRASETGSLPFLQGAGPVTLKTASGHTLPIPEPAHEHSLTYLAYLLTRERWYLEELKSWATYNVLTRPKNADRLNGILWSGQIRAAAWSIRSLLDVTLACKLANDPDYETYRRELITNLCWMRDTFTIPGKPDYRSTGVCNLQAFRPAPLLEFVTINPRPRYFATWNHHILASVLNECVRAGFTEAIPMRDHLTRVVQGQWQHGLSPYHIGWGNHAFNLDSWPDIIRTTFEAATFTNPPRNTFPSITTPDYIAWARSAVVAAVDANQPWAISALKWIDENAPSYKGGIPAPWKINPVNGGLK